MFFTGKSKQLPYLGEYLTQVQAARQKKRNALRTQQSAQGLAWIGGAMAAGSLILWLLGLTVANGWISWLVIGSVLMVAGFTASIFLARERRINVSPTQRLEEESGEVAELMYSSMTRRRLHRELQGPSSDLLEESARHWSRVSAALNSPYWTSPNLPAHWQAVRSQSLAAADQAMQEMLILMKPCFQPDPTRSEWKDVMDDVIEKYVTGPPRPRGDQFPVVYDQARELAEKLKLIASEVERATEEVSRDETVDLGYRSAAALDLALHDLRTIREAEDELRQNLQAGQGDG